MWAIRILTGPQAGKIYLLKPGANSIGRAPECDIKIESKGVSKKHAEIFAFEDKVVINDVGSANGTFANGVKVKTHQVNAGDKMAIHDVVFAVIQSRSSAVLQGSRAANYTGPVTQNNYEESPAPDLRAVPDESNGNLQQRAQNYFDGVVMPGIYKLAELTEFKTVFGGFLLAFILAVTSLQVLPMVQRLKSSVQSESQRRALTIAKNLVAINQDHLIQGRSSALDVSVATREEGVTEALLVSTIDSTILAPATKAHGYSTHPFVAAALKDNDAIVKQISDSVIGASMPIKAFNPETGSPKVIAHAIVLYNMGALAIDNSSTVSLFVINLFIALIVGVFVFVFLYKLVEYPYVHVNDQLDQALKDGTANVEISFLFPPLQKLCSNINSALSRSNLGNGPSIGGGVVDRVLEAENLLKVLGLPAIAINGSNESIIAANPGFERLTGTSAAQLRRQTLDNISDMALRQNLKELLQTHQRATHSVATSNLDFGGQNYEIFVQSVMDSRDVAYYIITFKAEGGS